MIQRSIAMTLIILYVSYGAIYKSADNKTHSNAYMFRNEKKIN